MVRCCGECPNYQYYSGGSHICTLVDQFVRNKEQIAPFCPLSDYPSKIIADLSETVRLAQGAQKINFSAVMMSYIASYLKLNVEASGRGIVIPFGDDKEVTLDFSWITEVSVDRGFIVKFSDNGKAFELIIDTQNPVLKEETESPEGYEEGTLFIEHQLSSRH